MAQEIERKYLLKDRTFLEGRQGVYFRQGYVATAERTTVRVRIAGETGFLTLKGPTSGISRLEFEYEIPRAEADEMLSSLCQSADHREESLPRGARRVHLGGRRISWQESGTLCG